MYAPFTVAGLGKTRIEFVLPQETRDVMRNMTRSTLSRDVERALFAMVESIARTAVFDARNAVHRRKSDPNHRFITTILRARMGWATDPFNEMRKGIRANVDRASLSAEIGAGGRYGSIAVYIENGYTFAPTDRMARYFMAHGIEANEVAGRGSDASKHWWGVWKWAKKNLGVPHHVQPRPFLRPAVERATEGFFVQHGSAAARLLFETWIRPQPRALESVVFGVGTGAMAGEGEHPEIEY